MRRVIPVIVVAALIVGGWFAWRQYSANQAANSGALSGSGTVEDEETNVSPLTSGRIVEARVAEGEHVKKGDVLFVLDASVARNQLKQAQEAERAARVNYHETRDDSDSTDAEIAAAKAQYEQAKVSVSSAKVLVSYATVTSPVDGIASSVPVDAGEIGSAGQTLAVISDPTHLKVSVYVSETEIGRVKVGDKATLSTDSSNRTFDGQVTFIASQAEFTPANIETKDQRVKLVYEVRVSVTDTSGTLKPGMPVDVTF